MGCGSSKEEDPNEIKSEMKKTLISSYDEVQIFFSLINIYRLLKKFLYYLAF